MKVNRLEDNYIMKNFDCVFGRVFFGKEKIIVTRDGKDVGTIKPYRKSSKHKT